MPRSDLAVQDLIAYLLHILWSVTSSTHLHNTCVCDAGQVSHTVCAVHSQGETVVGPFWPGSPLRDHKFTCKMVCLMHICGVDVTTLLVNSSGVDLDPFRTYCRRSAGKCRRCIPSFCQFWLFSGGKISLR